MRGAVAGAALVVVLPVLAACSSGDSGDSGDEAANTTPSASASASDPGGATANPSDGASKTDATDPPSGGAQASAKDAVSAWLTAVLRHDYQQACSGTAEPAKDGEPAKVAPAEMCAGKGVMGERMTKTYDAYRELFTPKGASGDLEVEVGEASARGGAAAVPAERITVEGQTLDKIILSHSTGLEPGEQHTTFEAVRIDGAWYSGDVDMKIGDAS